MESERYWVGLDLGQTVTHVCIMDHAGEPISEQPCDTSFEAIREALSVVPTDRIELIAAEAATEVHVVRKIRNAGLPMAIFETRKARRFLDLRRNKTDASDARGLADLGRLGRNTVSTVYIKSPECQQLRSLLVMRHKLVKLRVIAEASLRSRFGLCGKHMKRSRGCNDIREEAEALIAKIRLEEGLDLSSDVSPLVDICENLRTYLQKLDQDLCRKANEHPICRRLMGIPGVGPIGSLSFYSAIEDPCRFEHSTDVAAYLGLVPRRYQSGQMSCSRGITKTGNVLTRSHLINAALVFSNSAPECELKAWVSALGQRIGRKRARVALARKLSIVMLKMWKTDTNFELYPSKAYTKR